MKFTEWVAKKAKKENDFKTNILKALSQKCGVSLLTLQNVERGGRMDSYAKAKQVSEATGGKVTVQELCDS